MESIWQLMILLLLLFFILKKKKTWGLVTLCDRLDSVSTFSVFFLPAFVDFGRQILLL